MSPLEFDPPLEPAPTIKVALVGAPKTGKTAGAASAPGPILYLNADLPDRMRFARRKYGDKVKAVTVKGKQTLIDATYAAFSGDYATIVVDPVGDVYRVLLEERLGGKVPENMNNHVLTQFRVVGDELERFCHKLCQAPVNVVFVFHEAKEEGGDGPEYLPDAGPSKPKLGRKILAKVDIVGFTLSVERDGERHYVAQLVQANGRNGGDGFNCLVEEGKAARELDLTEWLETIKASEQSDAA